ncbi:MAG: adenylate/guanylate cyclase domain-containing protein, partial [Actinomycetota bacterium]
MSSSAVGTAERKFVSVLFADLTGFTSMCESLDPEDVHEFLLPSMTALRRTVESHGGSVVQVSGDGFLAVFGAPAAQEDHAERAVRAALALRDRVRELNAGSPPVRVPDVHAGVNAGEVFLAPSDDRTGFTVFGDVVNVASRLCGMAPSGGVLAAAAVRSLSSHAIVFGPIRTRRLRGRREPVAVSEALRPRGRVPGGRAPSRGSAIFVGRDDALEALAAECAAGERDGRSRILIVSGDAGIGKSRLSSEFRRRMTGAEVLAGRCSPYGQRLPLSALAAAIAVRAGVRPGGGRR